MVVKVRSNGRQPGRTLWSKGGREITAPHFTDRLPPGFPLCGELWLGNGHDERVFAGIIAGNGLPTLRLLQAVVRRVWRDGGGSEKKTEEVIQFYTNANYSDDSLGYSHRARARHPGGLSGDTRGSSHSTFQGSHPSRTGRTRTATPCCDTLWGRGHGVRWPEQPPPRSPAPRGPPCHCGWCANTLPWSHPACSARSWRVRRGRSVNTPALACPRYKHTSMRTTGRSGWQCPVVTNGSPKRRTHPSSARTPPQPSRQARAACYGTKRARGRSADGPTAAPTRC